ncbi:hypothetical protein CONLIGDRAFT_680121 [Coniochaeta ligniaria NRRL 30616]|uniref:Uncharacterized protein n=1 Tax=Coniochaeta ligniaria NRRL 30616 TaxID=1408157 RepID=A0A1J7IVB3_9PEZI|nr:hypothetical protein CONLIGDRAFT_680121 [Coniochaeta ligniaria NRRL 30616]
MSRVSRGSSPFLATLHPRLLILALFFIAMFLVNGVSGHRSIKDIGHGAAQTNCCTITWGSPIVKPTVVFSMPVTNFWALSSAVVSDVDFEDLDMDESQFEIYRMDRVHQAIQRAECLANDWPELDLQWCLADWHDGKLIPDPLVWLGETCWWNPWQGWSLDPAQARKQAYKNNRLWFLEPIVFVAWYTFVYLYISQPSYPSNFFQGCWKYIWTQGIRRLWAVGMRRLRAGMRCLRGRPN